MAAAGDDQILMKVAVFGIAMSLVCTVMVTLLFSENGNGDYDYDAVSSARSELVSFSGETMLNESPWELVAVYTPWNSSLDASTHTDADGWLYGESIEYSQIGKHADISLDASQKSTRFITVDDETYSYEVYEGKKLLYTLPAIGGVAQGIASAFGLDVYNHHTETASNWDYTGYRYVFDPMLPFSSETSTVDGSLSLVWYDFNDQEGLSGGLDIYGGSVKLATYSAADIAADYNSSSGYATTYDFDFEGTHLTLSIKFDQSVIEAGMPLMQAWSLGYWTMAISSASAGNFFDIDSSTSFTVTAGNMIETFIQIYTFDLPSVDNTWMDLILWILVGLPMTLAMLCITLRLINGFRVL